MSADTILSLLSKVRKMGPCHNERNLPSIKYLNECFLLNEDGSLIWKDRPPEHFGGWYGYAGWNKKYAGKKADVDMGNGYFAVCIKSVRYKSHRVVFAIHNGFDPFGYQIDHINCIKSDNRPCNLRLANQSQNSTNFIGLRSDNKSGLPRGVSWKEKNNKFQAMVTVNGASKYLGLFDTLEQASLVAEKARIDAFGGFYNVR